MIKFSPFLSAVLITLIILLTVPSCLTGSPGGQEGITGQVNFTVEKLRADFRQFRQFLEESHPQMYRFTSRKQFDSLFRVHYQMIKHPMDTQEFYRILIPLVARVACGHTSLWTPEAHALKHIDQYDIE